MKKKKPGEKGEEERERLAAEDDFSKSNRVHLQCV
jgi:hypothetical protein